MPVAAGTPRGVRTRLRVCAAGALTGLLLLAGCTDGGSAARLEPSAAPVVVEEGITYWTEGGTTLRVDACVPAEEHEVPADEREDRRAIVLVHGGGFTSGGRADSGMRRLCEIVAENGAAAFSIDYRLVPDATYPAQVDDLASAVRWLREPEQVERFRIDPGRIGVLGSSAGAIIAQTLATRGQGAFDRGERVGAVVSLSGVSALTASDGRLGDAPAEAVDSVLAYLGCTSADDCPQAREASPVEHVDATDPPMLLLNGSAELVPPQQAEHMKRALDAAGVPCEISIIDTSDHGTALLDADVRRLVFAFFQENL